ncbi:uncharacterized protein ACLA_045640 [Aspergillus clavatus NRRL 1]|uniref:Uncharacterized protein n=1 Tax=Aspergillus clavatus (strain ATCC 1007 / CBS 513.65 / DSM 816 / NCTC 3887 / NRRL 1 / QM 1276 / 107) TaxID=344612 RepID=A1CGU4_ASPCL|nr:uncharacterized protein ACLA_045640 [Aspergillus clavatus NRRL 1]EAW10099.1 conserved hypothetical protein [Aspergillus clavatus NRRL 1]
MSAPANAYKELAHILQSRGDRTLEIEILPPDLGPLLQDGCSVGITKKYLVQAFVAARSIFFKHLGSVSNLRTPVVEGDATSYDDPSIASEIILLFDCEHLTACNWRKKQLDALIRRQDPQDSNDADRERLVRDLETERSLLTTYLCSPLHRHTKSPTLWQHRLWLLEHMLTIYSLDVPSQPLQTAPLQPKTPLNLEQKIYELFQVELTVVLRAGELHPRNYYAFSSMRQLHAAMAGKLDEIEDITDSASRLALAVTDRTLDWCLAHPTDISGWMFMLYLLEAIPDNNIHLNIIDKAVMFGLHVRWEGESLWTFVQLASRVLGVEEAVWEHLNTNQPLELIDFAQVNHERKNGLVTLQKSWKTWMARAKDCWTVDRPTGGIGATG